jgi:hypothetical protein
VTVTSPALQLKSVAAAAAVPPARARAEITDGDTGLPPRFRRNSSLPSRVPETCSDSARDYVTSPESTGDSESLTGSHGEQPESLARCRQCSSTAGDPAGPLSKSLIPSHPVKVAP